MIIAPPEYQPNWEKAPAWAVGPRQREKWRQEQYRSLVRMSPSFDPFEAVFVLGGKVGPGPEYNSDECDRWQRRRRRRSLHRFEIINLNISSRTTGSKYVETTGVGHVEGIFREDPDPIDREMSQDELDAFIDEVLREREQDPVVEDPVVEDDEDDEDPDPQRVVEKRIFCRNCGREVEAVTRWSGTAFRHKGSQPGGGCWSPEP